MHHFVLAVSSAESAAQSSQVNIIMARVHDRFLVNAWICWFCVVRDVSTLKGTHVLNCLLVQIGISVLRVISFHPLFTHTLLLRRFASSTWAEGAAAATTVGSLVPVAGAITNIVTPSPALAAAVTMTFIRT